MSHTDAMSRILRPGIRTFKPRRSRITPRQQRALDQARTSPEVLLDVDTLDRVWSIDAPVVMDIGFGSAEPVVQLAQEFPDQTILAVDVHTPGVGDLVDRVATDRLSRVFVVEADALELLPQLPGRLAGVRSYFPDPWPKARHHKRRLVQPAVLDALAAVVSPGGFWHLATDWAEYAGAMIETFDTNPNWSGGAIERPTWRPTTHFERRAIREGRTIADMWFTRNSTNV